MSFSDSSATFLLNEVNGGGGTPLSGWEEGVRKRGAARAGSKHWDWDGRTGLTGELEKRTERGGLFETPPVSLHGFPGGGARGQPSS